jgi:hypothetical protein
MRPRRSLLNLPRNDKDRSKSEPTVCADKFQFTNLIKFINHCRVQQLEKGSEEQEKENAEGGPGFAVAGVLDSPPPPAFRCLAGQVRELLRGAPTLSPSLTAADLQRQPRIHVTASRRRSRVEKLITER